MAGTRDPSALRIATEAQNEGLPTSWLEEIRIRHRASFKLPSAVALMLIALSMCVFGFGGIRQKTTVTGSATRETIPETSLGQLEVILAVPPEGVGCFTVGKPVHITAGPGRDTLTVQVRAVDAHGGRRALANSPTDRSALGESLVQVRLVNPSLRAGDNVDAQFPEGNITYPIRMGIERNVTLLSLLWPRLSRNVFGACTFTL